jgi:peptide/nickel transport system substrate-binding protein
MQQTIVPSSEYGKLLPKNIWDIIAASQYAGSDSAKKKQAKKAQDELTKLGKQVTQFAPKEDISAGPFVLKNLNPGEAYLVKNKYFYAADKVKVNGVVFRNYTGNQQIWNYLIAGQLDASPFTAMPQNTLDKILKTNGNQKVVTPSFVACSLAFNEGIYPYGMPEVRKALAYVIDRNAVQKVAEPVVGTVSKYTDGMVDDVANQWLDSSQTHQMNPYDHDLQKATQLLQKAGFRKVNSRWVMPNGKPWTATIYTVNGFNDWIEAAKVISTEMTSFGIPTQPSIVSSYAQYLKELAQDKYAIGFWLDALGPAMYSTFGRLYGMPDGYQVIGGKLVHYPYSDKTKGNWLGLPTEMKLPNRETVNPGQLTYELNRLTPDQQRPIVQKLALVTNANLPVIELWNYVNVQFINTTRFTDFPVNNPGLMSNMPGVWMAMGYVHPKSSK